MRRQLLCGMTLAGLVASFACLAYADQPGGQRNFTLPLAGQNEVPPRETQARGVATFRVSEDGTSMDFKLNVANIENVVGAHIHSGTDGVNGPIVVGLYSAPNGGGRIQGTIAQGTVTSADVTGPFAGSLSAVIAAMRSGNAYVNVHTNDGVAPTNTGPGDFPGGEIRGDF
jgi:hypothetical protein